MKPYRFFALALIVIAPFARESLIGIAQQPPPASATRGPFDGLRFRPIGPAGR